MMGNPPLTLKTLRDEVDRMRKTSQVGRPVYVEPYIPDWVKTAFADELRRRKKERDNG